MVSSCTPSGRWYCACPRLPLLLACRRFLHGEPSSMPDLGKKYTCYSCHTKFYDLGKAVPLCPKCGADQRDAEEAPVAPTSRSRSRAVAVVVEEPIEEPEFAAEGEGPAATGDEGEDGVVPEREEPEEEEEEEEEY